MSNYTRVLPRDLFNEASLLKCIGALWIALEKRNTDKAGIVQEGVAFFDIQQNSDDGSIFIANLDFIVNGGKWVLSRPLNSRAAWPLYATTENDCIAVFDDDGSLSEEFRQLIGVYSDD